ncbi:phosphoglyceromutase [Photobacterium angustum]|uniref:2,3-diphosphoglycerate-dependent phosphoglycerate mutase n=1 Tax=Photobacterium angustum TaxID=661 RepID=UPI0005E9EC44|nr:2,3-diphosphoglycerate-dependent phosphoglycerate mutase [Photobacterium angustum]KJF94697.1 phosphoglyceromutase [Photobacterium angustum]KJG07766.1 phosphoglyceromutase [Photobacterium angustum]PSV94695.1 2,3-diphosphoglycerate-dependent phosphoglycerate mutase [Photobacterium angustum]PSW81300.1 2,3-diphosphoglycerate-dependent phosphoglycerate mutase [Photobacterium angustum]
MKNTRIVLLRHGQSVWNKENRFTGWANVSLSELGENEARNAGIKLKENGFNFNFCYTSMLDRAIKTSNLALEQLDSLWIPVEHDWQLNERHYGDLQGLNKAETAEEFGDEQVHIWRRSYDIEPPQVSEDSFFYPGNDRRYQELQHSQLPHGESLKDTYDRVIPFWNESIVPNVKQGSDILIAAHGNSLRALIKYLDNIPDDKITELEIPTGAPLVYEFNEQMKPVKSYYL